uniref:S1C family serine protease n=1 Tax=Eubacterium cellulosolvens TaxID=29322 RepID=UPI0006846C80|nr:trypsin-like peptidase domain-containing protein [[Eubacterium] cellulosolvens]
MDQENDIFQNTDVTGMEVSGTDGTGSFPDRASETGTHSLAERAEEPSTNPSAQPPEELTGFGWLQKELEKDRREKEEQRLAQQEGQKTAASLRSAGMSSGDTSGQGQYFRPGSSQDAPSGGNSPQGLPPYQDPGRPDPAGPDHPEKRDGGRKHTTGGRWAAVISMALVFGLISGLVMFGVNAVGTRLLPASKEASTSSSAEQKENKDGKAGKSSRDGEDSKDSAKKGTKIATVGSDAGEKNAASGTTGGTVAQVAADCMPSLVTISTMSVQEMQSFFGGTQKYQVQGAGTGVIIGQNDTELLIATNNHVVEGAQQLSVGFVDESAIAGQIKGTDPDNDLAVVAVSLSDIPEKTQKEIKAAVIGDSDELVLGQQVVAIGNALGYGQSVTSGYVSGLNRSLDFQDGNEGFTSSGLIQTDAAINSGNSGGALLNMQGELVGINEAKSSSGQGQASVDNIGYAIPLAKAEPILQKLMTQKTRTALKADEQGYLGVTCADVTSDYAQMYQMPEGVCFTSVVPDGPADQAGIQKGDVLTSFDGKKVKSYEKLQSIMQYYGSGEKVEVIVQRQENGEYKEKKVTLTLGAKDVLEQAQRGAGQGQQAPDPGQQEQEDSEGMNPYDLFRQFFGDGF